MTAEASESFCLPGVVTDTSYSGPHEELCLRTEVGDMKATLRGDMDLFLGDKATVSWAPSASWLVPTNGEVTPAVVTPTSAVDLAERENGDLAHAAAE